MMSANDFQNAAMHRRRFLKSSACGVLGLLGVGCNKKSLQSSLPWFLRGDHTIAAFVAPQSDKIDPVAHALMRLTWGISPGDYARVRAMAETPEHAVEAYIEEQLLGPPPLEKDASPVSRRVLSLESIHQPIGELYDCSPRELHFQLTQASLLRAVYSPHQLYEVMVAFWTDHFSIDFSKSECRWVKAWDDKNVIRPHALGNFRDLLEASVMSPAMLHYLDGKANRVESTGDKPNENHARELLELHTLGVHGGYTQHDVMEVARCLTGWTVNGRSDKQGNLFELAGRILAPQKARQSAGIGRVHFVERYHDRGSKKILGIDVPASGSNEIAQVLDLLAYHPSTALHLATKLCRRFIADDPPMSAIQATADAFLRSRGDIRETLRALFRCPEFLRRDYVKFKRPFHYIASAIRALGATTHAGRSTQRALRRMGHMPFDYPTPEGYSDVMDDWTATLLARWDFSWKLVSQKLDDTRVRLRDLEKSAGGRSELAAHLLGRLPSESEICALADVEHDDLAGRVALLLASPAFQEY